MGGRVLYFSQTGMTEPLGRSQVLPYLYGLARLGWQIEVFASEPASASIDTIDAVAAEMARHELRYHGTHRSASHSLPTKAWESASSLARLSRIALSLRPDIVHARSTLPAVVARTLTLMVPRSRLLFDCRGLVGEEYVDFGHWARGSLNHRLMSGAESMLFKSAQAVVVLTASLKRWLRTQGKVPAETPIEVVPCCVDVDRFAPDEAARSAARRQLDAGDRFVLVYVGNLSSWYCEEEMARLFSAVRRRRPALFAIFSHGNTDRMRAALAAERISPDDVRIARLPPAAVPGMLAGADAAISFARPSFSKIASSPVKIAEYLAAGLPVAMNRGVGDCDELIDTCPAVIDVGDLNERSLETAAARMVELPRERSGPIAVETAASRFSVRAVGVPLYADLYRRMVA
jgi:glycosyltransferase involved in cell wall biosynthesis